MKHKRKQPEEVWMRWNSKANVWEWSFDPPLKRHELQFTRLVNESELELLRNRIKELDSIIRVIS